MEYLNTEVQNLKVGDSFIFNKEDSRLNGKLVTIKNIKKIPSIEEDSLSQVRVDFSYTENKTSCRTSYNFDNNTIFLKEKKVETTELNLTQQEIKAIRKLLLKKQKEQIWNEEYTIFERSIEMELYQLFTRSLKY
jgi:uncharacterized Zn finger protein